jgi:hypothetical protein
MSYQTSEVLRRVESIENTLRRQQLPRVGDVQDALWLCSQLRTALKDTERWRTTERLFHSQDLAQVVGGARLDGIELVDVIDIITQRQAAMSPTTGSKE